MDIGEYKRTTIVKPATIPVPVRDPQPDRISEPIEKPALVPVEDE